MKIFNKKDQPMLITAALMAVFAVSSGLAIGKERILGAFDNTIEKNAASMLTEGRKIFRFDTFGSEQFWGGALRLHEAILGDKNGGVGPGVSPKDALAIGLKVDLTALPEATVDGMKKGKVDLDDPKTSLALLEADAVVGIKGFFDNNGKLTSVGIRCSLCHSTVDDTLTKGVGLRLDGWPNRDLNVGAIINLSPDLKVINDLLGTDDATTRKVLKSWGPGKFDAELVLDGKAFRPDGKSAATLLPAAYGLAGVNLATYTGWGTVTYWNAFVSNLEMHGVGSFFDARLDDAAKFPIAAREKMGHKAVKDDKIASKLAALHYYQLSIPAPKPPKGTFDPEAASRGEKIFKDKAKCATCHQPPLYSEPGWNMHKADEIGIDDFQAMRSPDGRYRTTPLRGAWARAQGGYYHDGRFADLSAVVDHYDNFLGLQLSAGEKTDLVEFVKSL